VDRGGFDLQAPARNDCVEWDMGARLAAAASYIAARAIIATARRDHGQSAVVTASR
jgi:hypothetical protein